MAASGKKNMFNEATRVQMPAMVHLTRLGYTYFGKITEDMAGTVYDPDTNILINVFKEQFARLNPTHAGEAEQTLKTIRQELDNDDIGRSFYERLSSVSPVRLVDFENPKNNTYHFTAEFTCKRVPTYQFEQWNNIPVLWNITFQLFVPNHLTAR